MGIAGAMQEGVNLLTAAIRGLPGGSVDAILTPPGGVAVDGVGVVVRAQNPVVPVGQVGAQRTGTTLLVCRTDYPTRPVQGTTIVIDPVTYTVVTAKRTVAFWRCEATRG
jgi:hypothetical protein